MKEFLLRPFTGFNALEIDCSNCKCLASLKNPACLECVNNLKLDFDLLELKKGLSTVYYEKGLSDSMRNDNFHVFKPIIIPSFLNYYLLPFNDGKVIKEDDNYVIRCNGSLNTLVFNPVEYNLSMQDLDLFNKLVVKIQEEELNLESVDNELPKGKEFLKPLIISYTSGVGLIDELLNINGVQDVYINTPGNSCLFFNLGGYAQLNSNIYLKNEMINKISTFLRARSGRPFDEAFPVLHSDIKHSVSRVCGITNPLSFEGSGFAIRKHSFTPFTLPRLVMDGFLSSEAAGLLWFLVDSDISLLITGARGSGKTTLLGSLLFEVDKNNRFIIIEDTKELPVDTMRELGYNLEHLRTSSFENSESFEFTSDTALRTALRLGESLLIIGEVRSKEAKTLFEAMRVGAAGNSVMGTIHGSSAFDTFDRIVNDLGVPPTSFKAADIVVSCTYLKKGLSKIRKVVGITEIRKNWFNNPSEENGFYDLITYNPKNNNYSFNKLSKSDLMKSISYRSGASINKCINDIKTRGKVIDLIVKKGSKDETLFNPEKLAKLNNLFSSLISKYDSKSVINRFKNYLNSFESVNSLEFKDNIIVTSLSNLKAVSKSSAVSTTELFKELKSKLSRSSFNKLLNSLENDGVVKQVKTGSNREWYLPGRVFKFLKP